MKILLFLTLLSPLIITLIILLANKTKTNKSHLYFEPISGNHTHTLIFMPGMTNTPEDFVNVLTTGRVPFNKRNSTKIVILRSQLRKLTALFGQKNYSWFDIYRFPLNSSNDYNFEELKESANLLKEIINEEVEELGKDYSKIIIGGHSQGAMIALYIGYTFENKLGGVSWSGF